MSTQSATSSFLTGWKDCKKSLVSFVSLVDNDFPPTNDIDPSRQSFRLSVIPHLLSRERIDAPCLGLSLQASDAVTNTVEGERHRTVFMLSCLYVGQGILP